MQNNYFFKYLNSIYSIIDYFLVVKSSTIDINPKNKQIELRYLKNYFTLQ